ncbi:amidohydrolase family protein [Streptomyces sp. NPDC004752]
MNAGATRLINATLIDGTGNPPVPGAVIDVGPDGVITYAGPARNAPTPPAPVRVADLGGRTLLPGFIDTHVHFNLGTVSELTTIPDRPESYRAFQIAERMRSTLHAGITYARDLGGLDAGFRDAVEEGLTDGPRLHVAVRMLSQTGGHADYVNGSGFDLDGARVRRWGEIVDSTDDVVRATRRIIRDGADVIKVCASGGISTPADQPDDEGLTEAEIAATVAEARRRRNRPVAAHAQGATGIKNAMRGGVASIEHGYGIDEEGIDLMLSTGTVLVPTLNSALRIPAEGTVPEYLRAKKEHWSRLARENISNALARGVRVALGTDAGIAPHGRNLAELRHLVELGLTPMAAIQAGTINAARLLGIDDKFGTIEAGKVADLVVCAGDPLSDMGVLEAPENILLVMQGGAIKTASPVIRVGPVDVDFVTHAV